jgi:hypothetical protein
LTPPCFYKSFIGVLRIRYHKFKNDFSLSEHAGKQVKDLIELYIEGEVTSRNYIPLKLAYSIEGDHLYPSMDVYLSFEKQAIEI